jgi:glycosyltransferase 2 family protein
MLQLAKFALAAAIVAWLCRGPLDVRRLTQVSFSPQLILLAAILLISMLLPAVRWWWLLRIQRIDVFLWQVTKMTWAGYVTGLILPGAVSGDLAKSYLICRDQPDARARSLSTVLVDRLIGLYSLILLGCMSGIWQLIISQPVPSIRVMCGAMIVLMVGSTLAMAAVLFSPVGRIAARFAPPAWVEGWDASHRLYQQSKSALALCLGLSLVSSALTAVAFAAADRTLGGSLNGAVSWSASLLIGPLVVLANCLPFTPGGIGVAEATSSQLFRGVGSTSGAEMMLAIRLMMALLSLPALLILFGRREADTSSPTHPFTRAVPPDETQSRPPLAA